MTAPHNDSTRSGDNSRELIAALQWIADLADKTYEQDDKLRSNGARALIRISDRARAAIRKATEPPHG